jgi:hypothetical protein
MQEVPSLINPLDPELNPICHFLALLGAHHILHVSRVRVNVLTPKLVVLTECGNLNDTCIRKTIISHLLNPVFGILSMTLHDRYT